MRHRMILVAVALFAQSAAAEYPPMPEAFSSFGAAISDGYVYVYGGHTGKTHTYSTEGVTGKFRRLKLADAAKGWEELPPGPGLQGLALVAHGGKIYRVGGMQPRNSPDQPADNHSVATCSVFDPKTRAWTELPDMPGGGRSSHDATVAGSSLVVVGGWQLNGAAGKSNWHETSLVLDLAAATPTWHSIAQPFKRRALNVAAFEGRVYAVAGMTWENEMDKSVDVLDLKSQKWSSGPALPGPVMNAFTPAVTAGGSKLYASPSDGKVYRLSEKKDGWEEVATLAQKRLVHRMVPLGDDRLLVLGGGSKSGNLALVEVVEPACCGKTSALTPSTAGQQQFCPVMTTVPVDADSREVEYLGVTIRVCCSTCLKKWRAEPEAYANAELLPQLRGKALPARTIAQVRCPVYPDRVVSSKDPSILHGGVQVYFFNETAKARFIADPTKYANPSLLPQLQSGN